MMIKIENEDHSYNAIDTFALWTEVNDFIKEYRINQIHFGDIIKINFRLSNFAKLIKPWQELNSDQKEKIRNIKKLMENPSLLSELKKGKKSFKECGLDKNLISTKDISQNVKKELKKHNISAKTFAKKVLGFRGESTVEKYLINPKPWNELPEISARIFLKMFEWTNNPNRFDLFKKSDEKLSRNLRSSINEDNNDLLTKHNIRNFNVVVKKLDLSSITSQQALNSLPKTNENSTQSEDNNLLNEIQEFKTRCISLEDQLKQFQQEQKEQKERENQEIQDLNCRLKAQEDELLNLKSNQSIQQPISTELNDIKAQLQVQNEKNQFLMLKVQNFESENQNFKVIIDQILFQQRQLQQSSFLQQQQLHNLQVRMPFQISKIIPLAQLKDSNTSK